MMFQLYPDIAFNLYTSLVEIVSFSVSKLRLGSQCLINVVNRLDGYGEKVFSELVFVVMTKWKLLLLIFTIVYILFRLLQTTRK